MRRKVLIISPDPSDATSFYRGHGPFRQLERTMNHSTDFYFPTERAMDFSWCSFYNLDWLFLQRPCIPDHLKIIDQAKAHGVKVWIDYDDNLLSVPETNQTYKTYSKAENRNAIKTALREADVVTVSTQSLAEAFKELRSDCIVINNAFDDYFLSRNKVDPYPQKKPVIMWRGSSTHEADLFYYADEIAKFANKHQEYTFAFLGFNPWFLREKMGYEHIPYAGLSTYFRAIQEIAPVMQFVTLTPNAFNLSKSNIAWIEGTFAGAACFAPAAPEWKKPGIWIYDNIMNFSEELEQALPHALQNRQMSLEYIQENLLLSKVNQRREEILRGR